MSGGDPRVGRTGILLVAFVAALLALTIGPLADPAPARAGVAATMESKILTWINDERSRRGIPALKLKNGLVDLAGDRAAKMAETGELKHAKCLSCKLRNRGISYDTCAENVAYTTWPWGDEAARSIFNGWKGSSTHWSILMSRSYTHIGIGVAYRKSNHSTWAAAVLIG